MLWFVIDRLKVRYYVNKEFRKREIRFLLENMIFFNGFRFSLRLGDEIKIKDC